MVKDPPAAAGDAGSIPLLGRFPVGGNGHPLQYSCLKNSMDRGAWRTYSPRDLKKLDTNEHTHKIQMQKQS